MRLRPDYFYEHKGGMICCGECWQEDITSTMAGKFNEDEAVYIHDLDKLNQDEAYQCDNCLTQNKAYEDLNYES